MSPLLYQLSYTARTDSPYTSIEYRNDLESVYSAVAVILPGSVSRNIRLKRPAVAETRSSNVHRVGPLNGSFHQRTRVVA